MEQENNKKESSPVNIGGRPPVFENSEALEVKIDEYFKTGVKKKQVLVGKGSEKELVELEVPTITGLALFVGFSSRQSFYDYEKVEAFSYTIKRARTFIECHYEELLQVGNTTGAIFALKNMGWKDKTETDHTTNGKEIKQDTAPQINVYQGNAPSFSSSETEVE